MTESKPKQRNGRTFAPTGDRRRPSWEERRERDRRLSVEAAGRAMAGNLVVLDTETTGLGHEDKIIEISCVNAGGEVLLDTFVRPGREIPAGAAEINGITDDDLAGAPSMADLMDRLGPILAGADAIASYNLDFDARLLAQSAGSGHGLPRRAERVCIMRAYAAYRGEWDPRFDHYRWHPLAEAMPECGGRPRGTPHGSLQNALGALEVLGHMARNGAPPPEGGTVEAAGAVAFCPWPAYPAPASSPQGCAAEPG